MQKSGFVARKCSKCGGSVYLDSDQFGWYEECLQCGFISDLQKIVEVSQKPEREAVKIKREHTKGGIR
jgi:hypothetical protein